MSYPSKMQPFIAIIPQTAAVASTVPYRVPQGEIHTLVATALATTEEIDIYVESVSSTKKALYDASGIVTLTATRPQRGIQGPVILSFAKDVTATACALEIYK